MSRCHLLTSVVVSRLLRLLAEAEGGEAGQSQGREGEAAEGCGGGRGGGRGRLGATGAAHTVNLSRKIISPKTNIYDDKLPLPSWNTLRRKLKRSVELLNLPLLPLRPPKSSKKAIIITWLSFRFL